MSTLACVTATRTDCREFSTDHDALAGLSWFRRTFYDCLTARADATFELAEAVLCSDGPVRSLVELSLVGEHRRGHGSLYAALSAAGWTSDGCAGRSARSACP